MKTGPGFVDTAVSIRLISATAKSVLFSKFSNLIAL